MFACDYSVNYECWSWDDILQPLIAVRLLTRRATRTLNAQLLVQRSLSAAVSEDTTATGLSAVRSTLVKSTPAAALWSRLAVFTWAQDRLETLWYCIGLLKWRGFHCNFIMSSCVARCWVKTDEARCRYCFYSRADFPVFRPAGANCQVHTDGTKSAR